MAETDKQNKIRNLNKVQQTALEAAANGIVITDTQGIIIWVNKAVTLLTGYRSDEMLGHKTSLFSSGKHSKEFYTEMWERITSGNVWRGEVTNRRKDGSLYIEDMTITPVLDNNSQLVNFIAIKQDITAYREATEKLRESNERFTRLINSVNAHFYMVEHSPESGFINKYFSNNIEELTGYARNKFIEDWDFWPTIVHPDDKSTYLHNQKKMLNGESMETEYRIVHANGSVLWVHDNAHVTYKSDGAVMIYATIFNITERKHNENRIRYLATHDPLTKLPNRIMFREILEHALEFAKRNQQKLAVFFLDVDNFKEVNDTYGHQIGDELLKIIAKRLSDNLRKHDTVSRISGDEFTLIAEQINRESHVEVVARKIQQILDGDYEIAGHRITVGVSVGGSIFPAHGDTYDVLIQKADAAMYKAKNTPGTHYCVYSEE